MIGILRYQNMRQQPRPGQAAVDRTIRRRRLHDPGAATAAQLGPHRANHDKSCRDVFQRLRYVLAQLAERAAAPRARFLFWRDRLCLARQLSRQRRSEEHTSELQSPYVISYAV